MLGPAPWLRRSVAPSLLLIWRAVVTRIAIPEVRGGLWLPFLWRLRRPWLRMLLLVLKARLEGGVA